MGWLKLLEAHERLAGTHWVDTWAALVQRYGTQHPLALAVLGGQSVATPGLAFLVGYQAALRALWPSAPQGLGAICATERQSLRPADLHTRIDGLRLNGQKDFVTAGEVADWLLVAARCDAEGEPARLTLTIVYPGEPGVRLHPLAQLPMMPEIGHSRLELNNALCERLAGDGWDAYVKPFRSLEDLYVLAASVAWLHGVGRDSAWPRGLMLQLVGLLGGCAEASRQGATQPATHVLLAGLFEQFALLQSSLTIALQQGAPHWAEAWNRASGLLDLAASARAKRLENALGVFAR